MMESIRLLLAFALTFLPGCVWMMRLVPRGISARASLVAGYGMLFGMVVIPVIMRGLSAAGLPFSFLNIGTAAAGLLLAGLLLPQKCRAGHSGQVAPPAAARTTRWEALVICLCAALIGARLVSLGMEAGLRPIFAWDGKQHWAKQARIFFETASVARYVPFEQWLELGGAGVYTTVHPDYPITIPLLQAWTSIALGGWHHNLINLPWVLCYAALGLIFYGQLRAAGAGALLAVASTYMLLSLPYLNIQVALAGYADIFMAACYLAAVAAFFNWTTDRNPGQAALATAFALSCLLVKNEGLFWLLSFLPGLLLVWLGVKRGALSLAALAVLLLLCLWLLPENLTIAGQSLAGLNLQYRPQSWPSIYNSFLVHDNWHLLGYIFIALLVAAATLSRPTLARIAPLAAVITSALVLYLALYLLTRHAHGAIVYTSINRVALQLMPAVGFLASVIFLQLGRDKPA